LLGAYVQPYFEMLIPFWETHDIDESLMFVKSMYPMTIVTPEVAKLTGTWLERELPGPIRRSLLESQDWIKRQLRTREFDSSPPLPGR
jgi:aminopeptidase N